MRRCAILRAPARRRLTIFGESDHAAQQIVLQEGIDAIEDSLQRLRRLEKQLAILVPEWSMALVGEAYQAMRGASFLVSVTFAAEIGDVRRFDTPKQLASFLGFVPAESSTGDTIRRKGLTLAGNDARGGLSSEAAWTYRYPARVSETLRVRLEGLPKPVRDIAWKANVRLAARHRCLSATGKKSPVMVAAIARKIAAFLWVIGQGGRARVRRLSSRCADPGPEHEGGELPSLVMWPGFVPDARPLKHSVSPELVASSAGAVVGRFRV
jgi:transposase